MAKKKKDTYPYYLDMNINIDKLQNIPNGVDAPQIFYSTILNHIRKVGKAEGGLSIYDHRKYYSLRTAMEDAMKVKETDKVEISADDFDFMWKYWHKDKMEPEGNEMVFQVDIKIRDAQSKHDKGEEDD